LIKAKKVTTRQGKIVHTNLLYMEKKKTQNSRWVEKTNMKTNPLRKEEKGYVFKGETTVFFREQRDRQ